MPDSVNNFILTLAINNTVFKEIFKECSLHVQKYYKTIMLTFLLARQNNKKTG